MIRNNVKQRLRKSIFGKFCIFRINHRDTENTEKLCKAFRDPTPKQFDYNLPTLFSPEHHDVLTNSAEVSPLSIAGLGRTYS
jgi:hypothetical protein